MNWFVLLSARVRVRLSLTGDVRIPSFAANKSRAFPVTISYVNGIYKLISQWIKLTMKELERRPTLRTQRIFSVFTVPVPLYETVANIRWSIGTSAVWSLGLAASAFRRIFINSTALIFASLAGSVVVILLVFDEDEALTFAIAFFASSWLLVEVGKGSLLLGQSWSVWCLCLSRYV